MENSQEILCLDFFKKILDIKDLNFNLKAHKTTNKVYPVRKFRVWLNSSS